MSGEKLVIPSSNCWVWRAESFLIDHFERLNEPQSSYANLVSEIPRIFRYSNLYRMILPKDENNGVPSDGFLLSKTLGEHLLGLVTIHKYPLPAYPGVYDTTTTIRNLDRFYEKIMMPFSTYGHEKPINGPKYLTALSVLIDATASGEIYSVLPPADTAIPNNIASQPTRSLGNYIDSYEGSLKSPSIIRTARSYGLGIRALPMAAILEFVTLNDTLQAIDFDSLKMTKSAQYTTDRVNNSGF